jgi:predicted Zn finger-like uncharacterized protein
MKYNPIERRSETRRIINKYYTVEFSLNDLTLVCQFKIWDISSKGISLLIKKDSDILHYLKVGDILNLKYHTTNSLRPVDYLKTAIKHISKDCKERFKGYCVVGLSISKDQDSEREKTIQIVCPACNTSYNILISKIPQRRAVFMCRKCGGKIVISQSTAVKTD